VPFARRWTATSTVTSSGVIVLPAVQDALSVPAITACEVIELKRAAADPAAGRLRFALGNGSQYVSTWQRATDYVARCMGLA
jgi:hypothetical protein